MSVENLSLNENSVYVGASVSFRGDLIASDTVIVEGTVEGNVTAGSVLVGTNGAIKGSLSAVDAEVKRPSFAKGGDQGVPASPLDRPGRGQDQLRRSRG